MRWKRGRWCFVGALACALACALAGPAEGRIPALSDEERASEANAQAVVALREGRKEDAVERFRAAWALFKDPWIMCNLGGLEAEMGRARDAAQSLSTCLRFMEPKDKQVIGKKVERELSKVRARVGSLTVEANVPDAEVVVDGNVVGKLPLADPIFVDPGSHGVEVKAPGYEPDAKVAVLHAGSSMRIQMRLEPMRTEVAPVTQDRAPQEPKREAESPQDAPRTAPVLSPVLAPKAEAAVADSRGSAQPAKAPVRAAVILTGFGLGLAGAVAGTAGLMAGVASREEAKAQARALVEAPKECTGATSDPCVRLDEAIDRSGTLTAVGIAGLALSAAGGAMIVYELVRSAPQGETTNMQVSLKAAPHGGVLNVTGSF
jgi:hypothetical protein